MFQTPGQHAIEIQTVYISTDGIHLRQLMGIKEEMGSDFCCSTGCVEAVNSFCDLRFIRERPIRREKKKETPFFIVGVIAIP